MRRSGRMHLSVPDLFVTLLLVAALVGGGIFFLRLLWPKQDGTTVWAEYTVLFASLPERCAEHVKVGDAATEAGGKYAVGQVTAVENSPATTEVYDAATGQMRVRTLPEHIDLTLRLRVRVKDAPHRITAGGARLAAGRKMQLRLPTFAGEGLCVEVRVL